MDRDIFLCVEIVFFRDVAVEMVLVKVQEHRHMRGEFEVGKLVTAQLVYDDRVLVDLVIVVEARKSDISYKKSTAAVAFAKHVVEEGRRGALSLGAGDTDGLPAELLHEKLGLRDILRVRFLRRDTGTLKDVIVLIAVDVLLLAFEDFQALDLTMRLNEILRGFSLAAVSPDEDVAILQYIFDLHD